MDKGKAMRGFVEASAKAYVEAHESGTLDAEVVNRLFVDSTSYGLYQLKGKLYLVVEVYPLEGEPDSRCYRKAKRVVSATDYADFNNAVDDLRRELNRFCSAIFEVLG